MGIIKRFAFTCKVCRHDPLKTTLALVMKAVGRYGRKPSLVWSTQKFLTIFGRDFVSSISIQVKWRLLSGQEAKNQEDADPFAIQGHGSFNQCKVLSEGL